MTLKKVLLLINILLAGLVLWMGFNIYRTWAQYRKGDHRPITANLETKKNGEAGVRKAGGANDYKLIISRDIFKTRPLRSKASEKIAQKKTTPVVKRENTDLELMGTVVGDEGKSFAIIKEKRKRDQEIYALDDFIGDAKIAQILTDRVVLERDGVQEILEISHERGAARRGISPAAGLSKLKPPPGIQRKIVPRTPVQPRKRPVRRPVRPTPPAPEQDTESEPEQGDAPDDAGEPEASEEEQEGAEGATGEENG